MITFDSALLSSLNAAPDKLDWSIVLQTLGNTRTLRCFRDSNSAAVDPSLTGTEFLNVTMTGAMSTSGGNITGFGTAHGTSIRTAADLSTGASCLRIEGNGHFMQGTLGLVGASTDFTVPSSPTTTSGIGFTAGSGVQAPHLLPSGTGPVAPGLDSNAPVLIKLYDWTVPSTPVLVGSLTLDQRQDDLVFDDADLAGQMGDVRITQSNSSIVFGQFEFGATLFSMNPVVNETQSAVLHQILVYCKPYGSWSTYPAAATYNSTTDSTFPKPFKVTICKADGTVIYTHQMKDGLAINSASLSQSWTTSAPLRPFFNCGMMLPWQSDTPKVNAKAAHYFPGVTAASIAPSTAKGGLTTNAPIPLANGRTQYNSGNQYNAVPQWPIPMDTTYGSTTGNNALDTFDDPYLYDITTYHASEGHIARICGWDYEPGSVSVHDWYTGPGGPRFDRSTAPAPLTLYMSNPSGHRLKGNVLYKTLRDAWGKAYFNHSHHYVTDVKALGTLPNSQTVYGQWAFTNAYYGQRSDYVPGGLTRHVDLHAIVNGGNWPAADKDGLHHWNGWALDNQHNYCQPGWWTLMFNSPMHLISAKLRHNVAWMAQLGGSTGTADTSSFYMQRIHAWRILHLVMMWKLSTQHALGISRAMIEDRFQIELETMYSTVYVPAVVNNSQSNYFVGLRNFGIPADLYDDGTTHYLYTDSDYKTFYMGHVLCLMKQTGCWAAMRAKSSKCQLALDYLITCLDKYSIDYFLDTEGRPDAVIGDLTLRVSTGTALDIPTSWADWTTKVYPKVGQTDWVTQSNGTLWGGGTIDRDVSQHLRAQYVFMRRDYFPEIANSRLTAACTLVQGWYDKVATNVAAQTTPTNKRSADWQYRLPSQGIINAPDYVGL